MDFTTFMALIASKFAEEMGKSAGQEFGKRLGTALAHAIFGSKADDPAILRKMLESITEIIQQALDQENIENASQLVSSGNLQLKQFHYAQDVIVGALANKTFSDAFGILESHPRTAIEVKAACAAGHAATLLLLFGLNEKWKESVKLTLDIYVKSLSKDLELVEEYELEVVSQPNILMTESGCKYLKAGDIMVCNMYWKAYWTRSSKAWGEIPITATMYAGKDGDLLSKDAFMHIVNVRRNKVVTLVEEKRKTRDAAVLEPIRQLVENLQTTICDLG